MSVHASSGDLELYVIGALDPVSAARVEAHVCDCDACAAVLAGEARLEMAFEQIAVATDPDRSQVRRAVASDCMIMSMAGSGGAAGASDGFAPFRMTTVLEGEEEVAGAAGCSCAPD